MVTSATTVDEEMILINEFVDCLDTGEIENIEELLCDEEKEEFNSFI